MGSQHAIMVVPLTLTLPHAPPPGHTSHRSRYLLAIACVNMSRYSEAKEALLKMGDAEVGANTPANHQPATVSHHTSACAAVRNSCTCAS